MGSVNLIVAVESVRSIVAKEGDELSDFHLPAILAVSAALGTFCDGLCLDFTELDLRRQTVAISIQLSIPQKFKSSKSIVGRPPQ